MMLHAPSIMGEGAQPAPVRLRALSLGPGLQSTTLTLPFSQTSLFGVAGRRCPDSTAKSGVNADVAMPSA